MFKIRRMATPAYRSRLVAARVSALLYSSAAVHTVTQHYKLQAHHCTAANTKLELTAQHSNWQLLSHSGVFLYGRPPASWPTAIIFYCWCFYPLTYFFFVA